MSDRGIRDQRRLHAWPAWDASISAARKRLGFAPDWARRPGEKPSPVYLDWSNEVGQRRFLAAARRALIDLRLPERFMDYWVACFLAPYERDGFEAIVDRSPLSAAREARIFPPPPSMWLEAGIDTSVAPAMLVIEGPVALASSTVLRAAERRALEARRRWGLAKQHPLARSRQLGPAQEQRARASTQQAEARRRAMVNARAWSGSGEKPWFIALRLTQRGYPVSERTVRRWLAEEGPPTKTDTPFGQNEVPSRQT